MFDSVKYMISVILSVHFLKNVNDFINYCWNISIDLNCNMIVCTKFTRKQFLIKFLIGLVEVKLFIRKTPDVNKLYDHCRHPIEVIESHILLQISSVYCKLRTMVGT